MRASPSKVRFAGAHPKGERHEDAELGNFYRSGLEARIAEALKAVGVPFKFEARKIEYDVPARKAKYTPDFELPNGIIVEAKGRFLTKDRQKHLHVKKAHPTLDIRFVFTNPNTRIGKKSKTTYAMWCEKNGFIYAKGTIPSAWIAEPRRA